eukprot:scaffold659_cov192-Ochromonas_danica.AAC.53
MDMGLLLLWCVGYYYYVDARATLCRVSAVSVRERVCLRVFSNNDRLTDRQTAPQHYLLTLPYLV